MDHNRLQLNFNGGRGRGVNGYLNERTYQASNDRVYPTTPSTFPHPVFPHLRGQLNNDNVGGQVQSPNGGGYAGGGGYFPNTQYQPQYGQSQQNQYSSQYQQQNLQSPQPSFPQRQGGFTTNDPNSGLARQFSNQNLGSNQRQGSPFGRHPSPNQRPRTGGATGQQSYANHLSLAVPGSNNASQTAQSSDPPEQDPNKYSDNIVKKVTAFGLFSIEWFKTNVEGTRDRNGR